MFGKEKNFGLENCENTIPLATTEALQILQSQQNKVLSDVKRQAYQKTFLCTLKYAETCSRVPIHKIDELKSFLQEFCLEQDELAVIASHLPQQVEEAVFLVPSLERFGSEIEKIVEKINYICNF
ncbi:RNA polymerase II subunit Rpb4 [Tubulinosema ratisbonensis]|uniref:RNA polymerase II subunit Rpb4 n=1 Tax=Tubulinosema ratisbonensis TaxID=291195 RepID=A0A437AJH0_9MICR|nr:RNA polymerase II subunit Rpb4 [Tubulinosema ratisbonensis]